MNLVQKSRVLFPALGVALALTPFLPSAGDGQHDAAGQIERGRYIVNAGSCNDCHTPFVMGPNGPAPDMTRLLSGHPEGMEMPPAPKPQMPWLMTGSATNTAWAGPWGVSFSANLTPDPETGIGNWTEDTFLAAVESGRHMGLGRPILPPMPVVSLQALTKDDLKAVFAYLKSLPPIKNRVPEPLPPAGTH